jgi:hypothetical protein
MSANITCGLDTDAVDPTLVIIGTVVLALELVAVSALVLTGMYLSAATILFAVAHLNPDSPSAPQVRVDELASRE